MLSFIVIFQVQTKEKNCTKQTRCIAFGIAFIPLAIAMNGFCTSPTSCFLPNKSIRNRTVIAYEIGISLVRVRVRVRQIMSRNIAKENKALMSVFINGNISRRFKLPQKYPPRLPIPESAINSRISESITNPS